MKTPTSYRLPRGTLNTPRLRHVAMLELWRVTYGQKLRTRKQRMARAAVLTALSAQSALANDFPNDADELATVANAFLSVCGPY